MSTRNLLQSIYVGSLGGDFTSEPISLDQSIGFCLVTKAVVESPTNKTFGPSDVSSFIFTIANHGYAYGLKIRFTTSGTLPAGISAGVDYYLLNVTTDDFVIATSMANLADGIFVNTTDGGSGTHTVNVQAAVGPWIELYGTIDDENYFLVQNSRKEITEEFTSIEHEVAYYHKLKVRIKIQGGQYNVNCKIMTKGKPN